jgi:hypothetical protein
VPADQSVDGCPSNVCSTPTIRALSKLARLLHEVVVDLVGEHREAGRRTSMPKVDAAFVGQAGFRTNLLDGFTGRDG